MMYNLRVQTFTWELIRGVKELHVFGTRIESIRFSHQSDFKPKRPRLLVGSATEGRRRRWVTADSSGRWKRSISLTSSSSIIRTSISSHPMFLPWPSTNSLHQQSKKYGEMSSTPSSSGIRSFRRRSSVLAKADIGKTEKEESGPGRPIKVPTILSSSKSTVPGLSDKSGTIAGAACLIIGTTVGSGILALPQKTSTAGFIPSAASMVLCWGFLLVEALLLAEVNVSLILKRRKQRKNEGGWEEEEDKEDELMSFKSMARETLGEWGGEAASLIYVFLGYTSMVAYASKLGDLLSHHLPLPPPILATFFTFLLAAVIFFGEENDTGKVNQWLTGCMIVLLVVIEVIASSQGGGSPGFMAAGDWTKIPTTMPVIIFSLVYHDIAPVICSYLDHDINRIRSSIVIGSLVPLISLLAWDAVMLRFTNQADRSLDPLELLSRSGSWNALWPAVEAFSLLAVGTSLIGTLLGLSHFFQEQLARKTTPTPPPHQVALHLDSQQLQQQQTRHDNQQQQQQETKQQHRMSIWWKEKKIHLTSIGVAVIPPLILSAAIHDAFSIATDIAGGYCMTMLYGVLPPAMAWSLRSTSTDDIAHFDPVSDKYANGVQIPEGLSNDKPALIGAGLFASGLILEQVLQDLSILHL